MRAFALIGALLIPPAQEQAAKFRELVDRLDSEDIAVADDAAGELTRLGTAALPSLRAELGKRQGELRRRLEDIVRRIERAEKLAKALGAPPLVSLRAKDRPVREILADLSRQSGLRVEGEGLPEDARASLEADRAPLWTAVDDLCRSHGGLMYVFTPKRLLVRAGPYRNLPRKSERGFFFFLDVITWTKNAGAAADSYMDVQAALVRPPRSAIHDATLIIEEFADDQGTNLLADPGGSFALDEPTRDDPEALAVQLYMYPPTPPSEQAGAIAKLKGRVSMRAALEFRALLTLRNPLAQQASRQLSGKSRLEIKSWKRTGAELRVAVSASCPDPKDAPGRGLARVVLRDSRGAALAGRSESSPYTGATFVLEEEDDGMATLDDALVFTLAEGTEVASLELLQASDVETISIPFEFRDIPLR